MKLYILKEMHDLVISKKKTIQIKHFLTDENNIERDKGQEYNFKKLLAIWHGIIKTKRFFNTKRFPL